MSLRRPFVPPRSTGKKSVGNKKRKDKEVESPKSPMTTGVGNQEEGYDQTPISEWRVSDDEEDLLPIAKVIVADKHKVIGHRKDNSEWGKRMERQLGEIEKRQATQAEAMMENVTAVFPGLKTMSAREADEVAQHGEVLRWSDEDSQTSRDLFVKGHGNLRKTVGKFFGTVYHVGTVTEVIPRRKGFYYKVTYEDGDQEDLDDEEFNYALQLRLRKDAGEDITNESDRQEEISGLSEEGSVYDSEEDRKALKQAQKKRKAVIQKDKAVAQIKKKKKWAVCPESVAGIGGPDSMLGKSMSRYNFILLCISI